MLGNELPKGKGNRRGGFPDALQIGFQFENQIFFCLIDKIYSTICFLIKLLKLLFFQ